MAGQQSPRCSTWIVIFLREFIMTGMFRLDQSHINLIKLGPAFSRFSKLSSSTSKPFKHLTFYKNIQSKEFQSLFAEERKNWKSHPLEVAVTNDNARELKQFYNPAKVLGIPKQKEPWFLYKSKYRYLLVEYPNNYPAGV